MEAAGYSLVVPVVFLSAALVAVVVAVMAVVVRWVAGGWECVLALGGGELARVLGCEWMWA